MNMDIDMDNFYFSMEAVVIPTITGSISFLSSLAIVVYIWRSKINTIYHRILFIMSVTDMSTSLAIALTTLPMPADVIYPFATPSYGTIATCNLQGYVYLVGSGIGLSMNGILNIYYVCTLKYHMKDEFFRRYVEPSLYFTAITSCLATMYLCLLKPDLINPTTLDSFCAPQPYPAGCTQGENNECRGTQKAISDFHIIFYFTIFTGMFTLTITMGLITTTFYKKEKHFKQLYRSQIIMHETNSSSDDSRYANKKIEDTRAGFTRAKKMRRTVNRQVVMYFMSFWLTWTCTLFNSVYAVTFRGEDPNKVYFLQILRMLTQPSQGLFNMLIFFYHKVSLVRRNDEDKTMRDAIRLLFCAPRESKQMQAVLSISLVYEDNFELKQGNILNRRHRNENAGVDVICVESRPRAKPSQNQGRFVNDSRVSFADSSEIAYEMRRNIDMAVGEKSRSGIESDSLAAASTGEHPHPDKDNASLSLGGLSSWSSLNGMLSLFSSRRSTNNISTIGEADMNSNAGLSFGGDDSFQNEDMISHSSQGNVRIGVHDRKPDRHFSRLSPVKSEVS